MLASITSHKYYGVFGLLLIIISYIHWLLPQSVVNFAIGHFIFLLGNILLFDSISHELSGYSLIKAVYKNRIKFFLVIGVIGGYFLELLANSLGHIWYYPNLNSWQYLLFMGLGFGFYYLYLIESYLGVKSIIVRFFKKHRRKPESFKNLKFIFIIIGFLGAIGLGASAMYLSIKSASGLGNVLVINQNLPTAESLFFPSVFILFFLFLFFDYLEYERHEKSLIFDIIKGDLVPLASILVASLICSLVYEGFVVPTGVWKYANIPFQSTQIFGIPLFVIIFWPFQYFILLSFYRILFRKETEIWS